MKKVLSLFMLLCTVFTGAWAFEAGTYTIKPYSASSTKYVVPNNWANRGGEKFTYAEEATMDNGGVWKFRTANDGFVIHPAKTSSYSYGSPNVWDASQHDEYTLGVWDTEAADQTWILEPVDGQENTYTIKNQTNSNAYFWYNSASELLYYKKTNSPDETNWFVVERVVTPPAFPEAGTYYLTFKGKDSGRVRYLYNDLTQADGYTLASSTEGTTNDFIWRAECDGTDMTIKNGQGQAVGMYGKYNNPAGTFQTNELTYTAHSDCYYLILKNATNMKDGHNCLNQPKDNAYKNAAGTYTVTSWSTTAGPDASDNHWYVTEVTDKDFYDVVITDGVAASGFNYSVASYANYDGQHAANGGFFAVAKGETIDANDVTVTNVPAGKQAVITVNDHTINITFETPANQIEVTYTFKVGDEVIGQVNRWEDQNATPTISDIIPSYVNVVSGMPDAVTESAYTIVTSYTGFPFEVGEKCYQLKFANGNYYIFANNSYTNAKEANSFSDNRDFKWQMGGNWLTGFTFRNLSGYYMAAPNKNPENSANTTVPTTLTDLCYFDVEENDTNGFRFKPHGGSNYLAHTSWTGLNVQFYNYAVGNTAMQITFTEVERISDAEIAELQGEVDALFDPMSGSIALDRVGYPKMTAATTLAVSNYSENFGTAITRSTYDAAYTALNNLYAETSINLPEDGKAYTIKAVYSGGEDMLYYDEAASKIKGAAKPTQGYIFVCKNTGTGKFLLVNEYGKYLTWGSSSSISSNASAVVDEYSEYADVTIAKATPRTNGDGTDVNNEGRFGLVTLQAFRAGTETLWFSNYNHITEDGNTFVESGATNKWYDGAGNRTHMYRIEEVPFPYTTKTLNNGGDGKNYATVALPYAMTIPTGVKAYAATADGDVLHLVDATETSQDVAAGAYILVSDNKTSVSILPAAATPESISNELQGSITATPSGDIYVLNKVDGVGFYKFNGTYNTLLGKAYLPSSAKISKFSFNFGEETTAISAVESERSNAEIYDLSGRKITRTQKGINIINGHKVIK